MKSAIKIDMNGRDLKYETLIRLAYCTKIDSRRNGGHRTYFKNLIYAENGLNSAGLPAYEDQFKQIAMWLQKALECILKVNLKPAQIRTIKQHHYNLKNAETVEDLELIINSVLNIFYPE